MLLEQSHELMRDAVRAFSRQRLAPRSSEWEKACRIPREVIAELGEMGLMGVMVPQEWGGAGADAVSLAIAIEEVAAGDGACATIVCGHNSVGCMPILLYGSDAQKSAYLRRVAGGELLTAFCLSEPHCGSEASKLTTKATRTDTGWVLDGHKVFVTSGKSADLALVFAMTDASSEKERISCFLVPTDTPGYEVIRVEEKMGQNASDTCEIRLNGLKLPPCALLGPEGGGYRIALANLETGRIGVAAQATGMARAALELAVKYAHERVTFGKPIVQHQAVLFRLADMATGLEVARQMYLHAAALKAAGRPCLREASMAKLFATETAERVCSDAIQTLGGAGYMREFEVERIYRSVRVCKIYEGTSDIQKMVIGRTLLERA